jgi:hypothetical protein
VVDRVVRVVEPEGKKERRADLTGSVGLNGELDFYFEQNRKLRPEG